MLPTKICFFGCGHKTGYVIVLKYNLVKLKMVGFSITEFRLLDDT